ncbi:hypothetical protein ACP3V3_16875 [Vibrio sp. PNB22_3_1]
MKQTYLLLACLVSVSAYAFDEPGQVSDFSNVPTVSTSQLDSVIVEADALFRHVFDATSLLAVDDQLKNDAMATYGDIEHLDLAARVHATDMAESSISLTEQWGYAHTDNEAYRLQTIVLNSANANFDAERGVVMNHAASQVLALNARLKDLYQRSVTLADRVEQLKQACPGG